MPRKEDTAMSMPQGLDRDRRWRLLSYVSACLLAVGVGLWLANARPNAVLIPTGILCMSRAMLTANSRLRRGLLGAAWVVILFAALFTVQSIINRYGG
jgi:hypothetical protein